MSDDEAYSENDDMKRFNTTGTCFPEDHYMVDLTERIREIRKMVDQGIISASIVDGSLARLQR